MTYVTVRAADFIAAPSAAPPRPRPPSYTLPDGKSPFPDADAPPPGPGDSDSDTGDEYAAPPTPPRTGVLEDGNHAARISAIAAARLPPVMDSARKLPNLDSSEDEETGAKPRAFLSLRAQGSDFGDENEEPDASLKPSRRRIRRSARRSAREDRRRRPDESPKPHLRGRSTSRRRSSPVMETPVPEQKVQEDLHATGFAAEEEDAPAARERTSLRSEDSVVPLGNARLGERATANIILWPRPERPELLWRPSANGSAAAAQFPAAPTFPTMSKLPGVGAVESDMSERDEVSDHPPPPAVVAASVVPPTMRPGSPAPVSLGSSCGQSSASGVSGASSGPSRSASSVTSDAPVFGGTGASGGSVHSGHSVSSGPRRISERIFHRRRSSHAAEAKEDSGPNRRSSLVARRKSSLLREKAKRRGSLGANLGKTDYYADDYVDFATKGRVTGIEPESPLRRARGMYLSRKRDKEEEEDKLSVTTSDDEYIPDDCV